MLPYPSFWVNSETNVCMIFTPFGEWCEKVTTEKSAGRHEKNDGAESGSGSPNFRKPAIYHGKIFPIIKNWGLIPRGKILVANRYLRMTLSFLSFNAPKVKKWLSPCRRIPTRASSNLASRGSLGNGKSRRTKTRGTRHCLPYRWYQRGWLRAIIQRRRSSRSRNWRSTSQIRRA